jgi:hypothetical protein
MRIFRLQKYQVLIASGTGLSKRARGLSLVDDPGDPEARARPVESMDPARLRLLPASVSWSAR